MKLEKSLLRAKTYNTQPYQWLGRLSRESDSILVLNINYLPGDMAGKWFYGKYDPKTLTLDYPSSSFDQVYLLAVLETLSREQQYKLLAECARVCKAGGYVSAISRAFEDAEELYTLLKDTDVDCSTALKTRLVNKDFGALRPDEVALFNWGLVIPDRKRLPTACKALGYEGVTLEHLFRAREPFPLKRVYAGLRWFVEGV